MNTRTKIAVLAASVGLAFQANANLITPNGILAAGNDSASFFNGLDGAGGVENIVLLYKAEYDDGVFGSEEGNTSWGPGGPQITIVHPDGDNQTATISWDLTGTGYILDYVAWKGGTSFLYSGVEEDQQIIGGPHQITTGLLAVGGGNDPAFSHLAFYGHRGETVPDGGATVMLLGSALGTMGLFGNYLRRKKA